jgi:hypothetical protein
MKKLFFLPLFLLALFGSAFAQDASTSILGKWVGAFPGEDGQEMGFVMTITDATYEIDFDMDGTAELTGAYAASDTDANQITIWDTAGEQTCPSDQKGVYKYVLDGDTVTFTKVTDACPGRGDAPMVLKRM